MMSCLERQFLRLMPNVVARQIDDQLVLVHLATHQMYSLNWTAARLWQLAEQGQSLADSVTALALEHAVPAAQVAAEADELIAALADAKLIEPQNG